MNHTPAPWQFDLDERGPGWPGFYKVETDILQFGWDGEEGIYIDNPDDARLLAAAPELYEALKSIYEHGAAVDIGDALLIRYALDKAEGKA